MSKTKPITSQIVCTAKRMEELANRHIFNPLKISSVSIKLLHLLKEHGAMTSTDLINLSGNTKSNLSQRLTSLEKSLYIKKIRQTKSSDKRKILLKITTAGDKKLKEVFDKLNKAHVVLESHFTKTELSQNAKFFKKINSLIDLKENEFNKIFNSKVSAKNKNSTKNNFFIFN